MSPEDVFSWLGLFSTTTLLVVLPALILNVPAVDAALDFPAHRLFQLDILGESFGSRASLVSYEARRKSARLRCLVTLLTELPHPESLDQVACMLVIVPKDPLTAKQIAWVREMEETYMQTSLTIPVYFAVETDTTTEVLDLTAALSTDAGSAFEMLYTMLSSYTVHLSVTGAQPKPIEKPKFINIQGQLTGFGLASMLPTIVLVAHYDSLGAAPTLSTGADSNGSGVVALLEIARVLSKLYSSSRTHPRTNVIFLLTAGGKLNYLGARGWLEDEPEIHNPHFVLCLDSLAADEPLKLHVSKPPKNDTPQFTFLENLKQASGQDVPVVHKKINLAQDKLYWEHERFAIRRIPAFTLSHWSGPLEAGRASITDSLEALEKKPLCDNTQAILDSMIGLMYGLKKQPEKSLFQTDCEHIWSLMSLVASESRTQPRPALVGSLHAYLAQYLHTDAVTQQQIKLAEKDPEVVFYTESQVTMAAYQSKVAVFDLFVSLGILSYLGCGYLVMTYFGMFVNWFGMATLATKRSKVH